MLVAWRWWFTPDGRTLRTHMSRPETIWLPGLNIARCIHQPRHDPPVGRLDGFHATTEPIAAPPSHKPWKVVGLVGLSGDGLIASHGYRATGARVLVVLGHPEIAEWYGVRSVPHYWQLVRLAEEHSSISH
jgi:hypothetical protein